MPDTTLTSAVNQLTNHQQQLDMDGTMVGVSRQALDIVLEALARAGLEAGKAEESMRERAAILAATFIHERLYKPKFPACSYHADDMLTAIRALPLTGGDKP